MGLAAVTDFPKACDIVLGLVPMSVPLQYCIIDPNVHRHFKWEGSHRLVDQNSLVVRFYSWSGVPSYLGGQGPVIINAASPFP